MRIPIAIVQVPSEHLQELIDCKSKECCKKFKKGKRCKKCPKG